MKQPPVFAEYGAGDKRLYVFSPVMPIWDAGEFFRPLTSFFSTQGYKITLFDSLSLLDHRALSFEHFVSRWVEALAGWEVPDLIAGAALGGALAQALVGSTQLSQCERLLLISTPTQVDAALEAQLQAMIDLANANNVPAAKGLLENLVIPDGDITVAQHTGFNTPQFPLSVQGKRLAAGFDLLKGIDLSLILSRYRGRTLSIYGQKSQLVKRRNVCKPQEDIRVVEIPKGGMRPLADNLPLVLSAIGDHLLSTAQVCE